MANRLLTKDEFKEEIQRSIDVVDAEPAEHFANPPYRAELFNEKSGWSGVMNKQGINCLTFNSRPGAVVTDYETARRIADKWNTQAP